MTRSENQIDIPKRRELLQSNMQALENMMNPCLTTTLQMNINTENAVVPFEEQEQDIPDFDLVSILNDLESNGKQNEANSVSVTTTRTSVLNTVPKSMFSNGTIQNVTFNIGK